MAGLCSGLTEAIVINPFEVVKVRLQAERQQFSQVGMNKLSPNTCQGHNALSVIGTITQNTSAVFEAN